MKRINIYTRLFFILVFLFIGSKQELLAFTPTDTLLKQLTYEKSNTKRVKLLNELGWNYLQVTPDSAKSYFNKALDLAKEINDSSGMTRALTNLAIYYSQAGDFFSSGKHLTSARTLAEKGSDDANLARIYGAIATNYDVVRLNVKSREFSFKCLQLNQKNQNNYNIAICLVAIAISYIPDSNYIKVNEYLALARPYLANYFFTPFAFNFYFLNAQVYFLTGNTKLTFQYLDSARLIAKCTNNSFAKIDCDLLLCKSLISENEFSKALKLAKQIEIISDSLDYFLGKLDSYRFLGEIFNALGNFKKSNYYFWKYLQIKDSLFNESVINNIQIIQSQYEFDLSQSIIQQKEYDYLLKTNKERMQRNLIIILILILIAYVILSFYLFRAYKKIKLSSLQLNTTFEEISIISKELEAQNHDLESLNSTKNKFFSIIGHDLRNPIAGIKNLMELLINHKNEISQAKKLEILSSINKAAANTYLLLENLLQWAKAQNGGIEYSPETIHLKSLINRVIALLNHSASQKNINIELNIYDLAIIGDYNLIETVLRNLISNAIKFTPISGLIEISVSDIPNSGAGKNYVQISVKDNGNGIPESKLSSLFIVGRNTSTKGTSNETGTGFGLLICKEFVNLMAGEINVQSEVGKGSDFSIILPMASINE